MANEHIGRRQGIGLAKESVRGTAEASPTVWIPKESGTFTPEFETAEDSAAYGNIDKRFEVTTTKQTTVATISSTVRDIYFGHILMAAFGTYTAVDLITITGQSGGTPARDDTISHTTPSWSGTIEKVISIGGTTYYAVSTTSGTLTDAASDLTDGTWTGGTVGFDGGANGHLFTRLNTNEHPTYTIFNDDPLEEVRAKFCMLDTLTIELAVGDFCKFEARFLGDAQESASTITPAYTAQNAFVSKHGNVYNESAFASLEGATAASIQRFKFDLAKNVATIQKFGSNGIQTVNNQEFEADGSYEAVYNAVTDRDYVINDDTRSIRFALVNDDVSTLETNIYPSLYIDFPKVGMREWSRSDDNATIVTQEVEIAPEYDTTTSMTAEALLINNDSTAY